MKRFLLFLLILSGLVSEAQVYNNEWIDYSKTYYKFKVGVTGLYRISQSTLASMGLGSTPAEHFQLWRNGREVPLYTSIQGVPLGPSDYIEFWGEMNDGEPDNIMYRDPASHLNKKWSLQTDTASFFLTVNSATANLRFVSTLNDVGSNTLPKEPFFIHTAAKYWKDRIGLGHAEVVGENIYSSAYDRGEGWASDDIRNKRTLTEVMSDLNVYTGPGAPTQANFRIHASGYNRENQRVFRVTINNDSILGQQMDFFDYVKVNKPFPVSLIATGTASISITNQTTVLDPDRMVVAQVEISYPRQFNFGNASNFTFTLPASTPGNYLEISNFNYGSTAPVLYDFTNGKRYVADISNPLLVKFALQPSATERKLLLVSEDPAAIINVNSLQQRNFVNYGLASNQGDYLIITHSSILNGAGGSQPVEDYKAYRSSAAGGGFNTRIYLIEELIDQFALGIKMHPLSVRNFLRWARNTYSSPIKNVFLIGKGIEYTQYRDYESSPNIEKLAFIPTFGHPASDVLLAAEPGLDEIPRTPIGRLSVIKGDEITIYLQKVIQYEQVQKTPSPLIKDKAWMKNVAHVIGASDDNLSTILTSSMDGFRRIIIDTFYGARVSTFSKTSTQSVQQANSTQLRNLFQEGIGIATYFGHSSASTLEFNLDNPENYNNPGKYPLFILLGCNAGNFFNYNEQRLEVMETISENFIFSPGKGSIATIASTHLGVVHYLDVYNRKNYISLGNTKYGKGLGESMIETITQVYNQLSQNNFYARCHNEQSTLHGDPAIKLYNFPKPDYVIEDQLVRINPGFISVAEPNFKVDAKFMNIGAAINKNIVVELKRTYPNNTTVVFQRDTIPGIRYIDSLQYVIKIDPTTDKGLNKITITVEADNVVDELFETNNTITRDIYIYEDEARPIYPYNYSIVNTQGIKFQASTANPFNPLKEYTMEIDTTELFNSPLKQSQTISAPGGILEFTPLITFLDSTVYYWRTAPVPDTGLPVWNTVSFIYLPNSGFGYNQSHIYQHFKSSMERITLDSVSRAWSLGVNINNVFARNGVYPTTSAQGSFFTGTINDQEGYIMPGCQYNEIIFTVIDSVDFKPWKNDYTGPLGLYNSYRAVCGPGREYNFQYSIGDPTWRKRAMDFIDLIPDGDFVLVRSNSSPDQNGNTYPDIWKTDEGIYGPGNSLYHKLFNQGFADLDSFNRPRSWLFLFKKNGQGSFPSQWTFSNGVYDAITLDRDCPTPDTVGYITSPTFGPAKAWHEFKWRGSTAPDLSNGDEPLVDIIGIDANGVSTPLVTGIGLGQQDYDISGINAAQYPFLQLKMKNLDTVNFTAYQLQYWRLTYDPVPEGAIAPNLYFISKDTVEVGEPFNFGIAFKNVTPWAFDSMKVRLVMTGRDNYPTIIPVPRRRPLLAYPDTLQINTTVPTHQFAGNNTMYVEVNPDNDQPEQHHFNNFAFRNLYVIPDTLNPLLDVTFDGVHILNRDIVSPRPEILVKLKDEAKWMVLNDTSLLEVTVRYPNGDERRFFFNNDTMVFTPAGQAPNPQNTATITFKPYFPQDGEYELIVTGKDRSDNVAGSIEYRVSFQVYNKPMISNMLNYPNPFTTSTAFVFTITGSEVPQNLRIQIMTITGKIVRDITKDELGPLKIGRNITEFKWDGTDQYGQKLANGIYLYRVITNLNGKALDKFKAEDDKTDKYFNKGYGKMYLMR